jgi:hypothetical protein
MHAVGSRCSRLRLTGAAALLIGAMMLTAPAIAQTAKAKADPEMVAENRVWIDEHARWQADHLAAARRLEAVVAVLKGRQTSLGDHGAQVRAHDAALAKGKADAAEIAAHAWLRAAHEEERIAHNDLMNAIELIELEVAKEQARERADRIRARP